MSKKQRAPAPSAWRLLDFQTIGSTLAWSVAAWSISLFFLRGVIDSLLGNPFFTFIFVLPSLYVTLAGVWRSRQSTSGQRIGEGLLTGALFFILLTTFASLISLLLPAPASGG